MNVLKCRLLCIGWLPASVSTYVSWELPTSLTPPRVERRKTAQSTLARCVMMKDINFFTTLVLPGILRALGHHLQRYPACGRAADQYHDLLQRGGGLHWPGPDGRGQGPRQLRDGDVPELHLCPRLPHAQTPDVSRGGPCQGEQKFTSFLNEKEISHQVYIGFTKITPKKALQKFNVNVNITRSNIYLFRLNFQIKLQVRKHRYVRPNAGFLRQLDELDCKLRRERGIVKAVAWIWPLAPCLYEEETRLYTSLLHHHQDCACNPADQSNLYRKISFIWKMFKCIKSVHTCEETLRAKITS